MRRPSGFLPAAVMISLFCIGQTQATTYYVNKAAGNDAAAGTSVSTAWATIGKANAALQAGDTVLIRAGTYTQAINPANSGTAGNPITYRAYPGEVVNIDDLGQNIYISKNYITVDGFGVHNTSNSWVTLRGANYCILKNLTISGIVATPVLELCLFDSSSYNQFIDNRIDGLTPQSLLGQQDLLNIRNGCHHNLIQGNYFGYASHSCFYIMNGCNYNVVRNNIFDNPWHAGFYNYAPGGSAAYLVFENNICRNCGTQHTSGPWPGEVTKPLVYHTAWSWGPGPKSIARHNVSYNNGCATALGGYGTISDTKFYHNTFYRNTINIQGQSSTSTISGDSFINNILYEHQVSTEGGTFDYDVWMYMSSDPSARNTWTKNIVASHAGATLTSRLMYGYSNPYTVGTLAQIQAAFPNDWYGNLQVDPQFVDAPGRNFALQPTSPAIDAGTHLTLTVGSGTNSTSLVVGDAGWFFSGPGAPWYVPNTVADTIYIEGSGSVLITAINHATNTITLASPMTWTSGKKVYHRAYSGSAPDIGAYEYQGSSATYTLSVSATNGTVSKTPNQTSYTSGQTVTLQATPNTGYTFSGWSGDLTGTANPATLVMDGDKTVTANFTATPVAYTLSVNSSATGRYVRMLGLQRSTAWGYSLYEFEVYGSGTGGTLGADSVNLALGKPAVASSIEASGLSASNATDGSLSESSRWSSLYSDNEWIYVDLGSVSTISRIVLRWEAAYGLSYKLQVSNDAATWSDVYSTATGDGSVDDITLSAMNGTVTKTPNQTSYTSGQTVTLQATPNAGYTFSGWSGDLTGTANPATLVMDGNKAVVVNFTATPVTYTLSISATNGTVTRTPNQTSYTSGQTVTLQATANTGYTFSGWSGALTGTANPATLVMDANKSVTANFTAVPTMYTLAISATNGTVSKTPSQTSYTSGQTVTLQATPNAGYTFSGWSGALTGTTNPATLVMDANKSVTANFAVTTYTLSVSASNGTVSKTPSQTSYTSGQTVTLQATPNTGYTFSGWSGDLTGTANPATLVMDANKSVTANFTAATYTLAVNAPALGRYVRMLGLQRGTSWGYSLYEFEVYGSGTEGALGAGSVNLALGKPAVASSVEASGLAASNATDGNLSESSRWSSLFSDDQWIYVDLGSVSTIGRIVLPWEMAYGRSYKLQVSNDAATWSDVYSTTAGAGGVDDITLSAPNGTVTKTPNQTSYTSGQTVTLQAVPNTGYTFSGWSGDLTGTANPATLVMDGNKTITASFTAVSATTYTLSVSATNGAVTKTPNQTSYTSGQTVTLQATPNTGYTFSGWSGALTGTANPATLVMDANKSVTANFTAVATTTYTLAISATNGTVAKTPNQTSYTSGQTVTLLAVPRIGYRFSGWSGDLTGTANPATLVMDGNKSVTASFKRFGSLKSSSELSIQALSTDGNTDASLASNPAEPVSANDQQPPALGDCSPAPDSIQAPPDTLVVLHIRDAGQGVDGASVAIRVGGHLVYAGDVDSQRTAYGICYRSGTQADYAYTYQPQSGLGFSKEITVAAEARDLAGNVMPEQTYSFATEMYSFGTSPIVSKDQTGLTQGRPATARDRQGNLWVTWQAGDPGSRHIYVGMIQPDMDGYGGTVQLSQSAGDHCHPAIAVDGTGALYVLWQENATGTWDVCLSASVDGQTWSAPKSLVGTTSSPVQPAMNRVNPAVAASGSSSGLIAAAWQEDRAGNQDIYVARSTNGFQTATISPVTSDPADQTDPALAIDGQDTIFVLWTDARSGSADIYGAASNAGPWTNVPIADGASNQSHGAVAVGTAGRTLHMAWVEDKAGNLDVFYAASEGLPLGAVVGASIIDDTSGADQQAPTLAVAAGAEGTDHVFLCWEDARNVVYSGATDLYFADVGPGVLRTNVPLEDGAGSSPHEAVLGADRWGYPYVVWVSEGPETQNSALGSPVSGTSPQLRYAGATYANPVPLVESPIASSAGGLVGTSPQEIATWYDVSVAIPERSCPVDATIRAAQIRNPRSPAGPSLSQIAFGPSGLVFAKPVTITIPYSPVGAGEIRVYWFDAATGTFREDGIANVRSISCTPGLAALQFETTRLGSFYLVSAAEP